MQRKVHKVRRITQDCLDLVVVRNSLVELNGADKVW